MIKKKYLYVALAVALFSSNIQAHQDLHEQIRSVSATLQANPLDVENWIARAKLHLRHKNWDAFESDLLEAQKLGAKKTEILFLRAQAAFDRRQFKNSVSTLKEITQSDPTLAQAWLLKSKVEKELKNAKQSQSDFLHSLKIQTAPTLESYLDNLALVDSDQKRLELLNDAIKKLGALPSLQEMAIELELKLGLLPSAMNRIEQILQTVERKEQWLEKKADLLIAAGKKTDAKSILKEALTLIQKLPSHVLEHRNTQKLRARLEAKLQSGGIN